MRIDHVALFCKDIEMMKIFLVKYIHAIVGKNHISKRTGQTNCFLSFTDGGSRLELMTYPDKISQQAKMERQSMAHLSISAGNRDNVNLLTKRLGKDGFQILSSPRITGDGYYESSVMTIDSLIIEITE